jgi:hypothetical protein
VALTKELEDGILKLFFNDSMKPKPDKGVFMEVQNNGPLQLIDNRMCPARVEAMLRSKGWVQSSTHGLWTPHEFTIFGESTYADYTWAEAIALCMFDRMLRAEDTVRQTSQQAEIKYERP